jgi:hypothetical protein
MSVSRERPGLGRHSRLAGAAVSVALAVLFAAGCSAPAVSTAAPDSAAGLVSGGQAATGFASAASTVVPPNQAGPPADPFAGSPAADWADGAAGIVFPAAKPIGPYTTSQVKYAYQTTRQLLVAGFLDSKTLAGGEPAAFESVLASAQRVWFEQNLGKKGVDAHGVPNSSLAMIMSFSPGSTQLIGNVIKVHGTVSAKPANKGGEELDVTVDYLFTYPVEPPHHPEAWTRVVAEAAWTVAFGNWQGVSSTFAPWVNTNDSSGVSGIVCGESDGYQHPAYPTAAAQPNPSGSPTGKPLNPYVGGQVLGGNCQATTGT